MPNINRRGFMQLAGAAGITPLLPALPAPALTTTAAASTSKALWASIYANSGSAAKFVSVAQDMGLSNTAIQGISARSIGIRVAVSAAARPISRTAMIPSKPAPDTQLKAARTAMRRLDHSVTSKRDKIENSVDQKPPTSQVECAADEPEDDTPSV